MVGKDDFKSSNYNGYGRRHYWYSNLNNRQIQSSYYSTTYTQDYSNREVIQRGGELKYKQRIDSHSNHRGDYYFESLGAYSQILRDMHNITGKNNPTNEKALAQILLDSCKTGQPISLEQLKIINQEANETNVSDINRIVHHCFVKEPARWMFPANADHELPLAIAQARAMQLIIQGHLSLQDVFGQNSAYGVFTGQSIGVNIEDVKQKIIAINQLYEKAILLRQADNYDSYLRFTKDHVSNAIISTSKQLCEDLKACYGGDSDTDGEGYSSSEDEGFADDEIQLFSLTI